MTQIAGVQKTTLVDYPGKVAATIFLRGCNFRCGFCHNPELVVPKMYAPLLNEDELFRFLESRVGKLGGVCITGGEPLLQPDTNKLVSHIKALGFAVKLDTNGSFSERLKEIIQEDDVDYIAMDIKAPLEKYSSVINNQSPVINNQLNSKSQYPNFKSRKISHSELDPESHLHISDGKDNINNKSGNEITESHLVEVTRGGQQNNFSNKISAESSKLKTNILRSIELIMSSGIDYEFRTTVAKPYHSPGDFIEIGKMIKGAKRYYIQNYVKSKQINCRLEFEPFSEHELSKALNNIKKFVFSASIR